MVSLPRVAFVVAVLSALVSPARAQDAPAPQRWTWTTDGNAFFGYNYQQRLFADFSAWESQNWLMASGERVVGQGRLIVHAMGSLEPFTISGHGSYQLFQTGESFLFHNPVTLAEDRVPLVNAQHPHDMIMGLGATYRYVRPRATYIFGADLVGSPTLGPEVFMHRDSARNNPQVPLTHHYMDSTHISFGVVRAGVDTHGFTLEASAFRGAEPDEHRKNIERPRLDSWAARLGWRRGPWSAQFSGGHLHEPEWFEPYDHVRLTASVGFDGAIGRRPLAATLGWGQNRAKGVVNGVSDGFLLEWNLGATRTTDLYGRAEIAVKQIFGLGFHPRGFAQPHVYSHVDAVTIGAVRELVSRSWTHLGIGADVTAYHLSPDLVPYYDGSHSYHVFLRWRPSANATGHVH